MCVSDAAESRMTYKAPYIVVVYENLYSPEIHPVANNMRNTEKLN